MKRKRFKSLKARSLFIIILCSAIFMVAATPIVQSFMYDMFHPYLVEYVTQKTSDSAILMSTFLSLSNNAVRHPARDLIRKYFPQEGDAAPTREEINEATENFLEPIETSFSVSSEETFSCLSYPAIYIDGVGIICSPELQDTAEMFFNSDWFHDKLTNGINGSYYPAISDADGNTGDWFCFMTSSMGHDVEHPYSALLLTPREDIDRLWRNVSGLGITDTAFVNSDYDTIYTSGGFSMTDFEWMTSDPSNSLQHRIVKRETDNETYCSVLVSFEGEGLRFITRFPNGLFASIFKTIRLKLISLLIALIAALILIIFFILRRMLSRLTALSDKMAVVRDGDYSVRLEDSSNDEIGQLAAGFNDMTDRIRENVETIVEKERREKQLQYNLMVSAIDPHFINNTLNTSTCLAALGRNDEVIQVNEALIIFLKDNLKMKSSKTFDTVENELNVLEQYIIIQNHLCFNTITLRTDVSDEDRKLQIPKFLLQPMVENAILHGIMMNKDKNGKPVAGVIDVGISRKNGRISLTIQDNGIGMTPETVEQYFYADEKAALDSGASGSHIGVLNVRTRLSLLYDDDYSIDVESAPGKGTKVTITIPDEL